MHKGLDEYVNQEKSEAILNSYYLHEIGAQNKVISSPFKAFLNPRYIEENVTSSCKLALFQDGGTDNDQYS